MYKVIFPQPPPEDDDISFWQIKEYPCLGLGIARNDEGDGFIPFPADEDPIGVQIVKRQHLWFWIRSHYYNLSRPILDIRAMLEPLSIFNDDQLRLIANCANYADNDPAGLEGHQNHILIANLYTLLALALNQLPEKRIKDIVEVFHCLTGGAHDGP